MLEWLDRYMAKFAQTDHIRREEHARRQEEASPAHEEAVALLEAFPYSGPGRARVIAAALSAITQETLLDAAYARRLLRAMVEGFSQADADVQTTLAPAQVALNLLPTLRAAATAGGSVGAPFALIEGTLAMRTGGWATLTVNCARLLWKTGLSFCRHHWTATCCPLLLNWLPIRFHSLRIRIFASGRACC